MRALLSETPGGPESLPISEMPGPVAEPGELLVRMRACAINYPDVLIIEDKYQLKPPRPFAPGSEIAGEGIAGGGGGVRGVGAGSAPVRGAGMGGVGEKDPHSGKSRDPAPSRSKLRGRIGA